MAKRRKLKKNVPFIGAAILIGIICLITFGVKKYNEYREFNTFKI